MIHNNYGLSPHRTYNRAPVITHKITFFWPSIAFEPNDYPARNMNTEGEESLAEMFFVSLINPARFGINLGPVYL